MPTRIARFAGDLRRLLGRLAASCRDTHRADHDLVAIDPWLLPMALVIAALLLATLYPFVDQQYANNYQFDTFVFAEHVTQFRRALATGDPSALPRLTQWPSYFDAYDVLLTVLTAVTSAFAGFKPSVADALPTIEFQTNFWSRWMSLAFHCAGMAFLWLASMRLYARPLVAFSLTMLVALAPSFIDIELGRNDWGVMGSLCASLYFNICIAQGDQRKRVLVGLGVAAALLATMKVNGPVFLVLLATAVAAIGVHRGFDIRRATTLLVAFIIPVSVLSLRQIYYFAEFLPNLAAQLRDLSNWSAAYPKPSLFYYSWDLLETQGTMYRALVWSSVPVVVASLFVRLSLSTVFVLATFSFFVIASMVVDYGFARGGYHLLPFFALMIAIAFAALEDALRRAVQARRVATRLAGAMVAALLVEPLWTTAGNYALQARSMYDRPSAVSITRTIPAQWMAVAFPKGTRVANFGAKWPPYHPPLNGLGFVFDETIAYAWDANLEPYRNFTVPSLDVLRNTADVLILTDWQQWWIESRLDSVGQHDALARWRRWLEMMRREVPSVVFSAPMPGYYYRSVEIFALDPASNSAALRAALELVGSPAVVRGP